MKRTTDHPDLFLRALVHDAAGRRAVWQAAWWRRLLAALVDILSFSPFMAMALLTYVRWSGAHVTFPHELAWYDAVAVTLARHVGFVLGFWVMLGASFACTRYLWVAMFSRTPGMLLLRLDFWTACRRAPGPLRMALREALTLLFWSVFGLGPLWAVFDESHRPLSDVITGVYFIDAEPGRVKDPA